MTLTERNVIEAYSKIFEGLSSLAKLELLQKLAGSLKKDTKKRERDFFKSFGRLVSEKKPEELAVEIKNSRKFRKKDLKF